jgi:hypothetical protein
MLAFNRSLLNRGYSRMNVLKALASIIFIFKYIYTRMCIKFCKRKLYCWYYAISGCVVTICGRLTSCMIVSFIICHERANSQLFHCINSILFSTDNFFM